MNRILGCGIVALARSLGTPIADAGTPPCILDWDTSIVEEGVDGTDRVNAMIVHDDGTGPALYVGGRFQSYNGVTASNVIRFDGETWSAVGTGVGGPDEFFTGEVNEFAEFNGELYAGGFFLSAGGAPMTSIARWDGTTWKKVGSGLSGQTPYINDLAVYDDGNGPQLYVAGRFDVAGGIGVENIARWSGTSWSNLPTGGSGGQPDIIHALEVVPLPNGPAGAAAVLVAGGDFDTMGNVPARRVAQFNGSAWSTLGLGMPDQPGAFVRDLATYQGSLYVAGQFESVGGLDVQHLARWSGGNAWTQISDPVYGIQRLHVANDGNGVELIIAGSQWVDGGWTTLASWDGLSVRGLGTAPDLGVNVLGSYDDGHGVSIYAAGPFGQAGGHPAQGFARYGCFGTLVGDLDGDGDIGADDLSLLLDAWGDCPQQRDCVADLNGDGVVDAADLARLLAQWNDLVPGGAS